MLIASKKTEFSKAILSLPPPSPHPHPKSLGKIVEFKNLKIIVIQLSTKPVTANVPVLASSAQVCSTERTPVTLQAFQPQIKNKVFFSSGVDLLNYESHDWAFNNRVLSLFFCFFNSTLKKVFLNSEEHLLA
jgi:hypothetical protein